MSRDIGVAVIGAGMAGRAHAHGYRSAGTVFSPGLPPVRLVSVADINEELAADTARRYGFERSDTSWQAIVKADDIDVVSVVVANHLHREMVDRARGRGQARAVREAAGPDVGRRPGDDRRRGRRGRRRPGRVHLPPDAGHRRGPPGDRVGGTGPAALHQRAVLDELRQRPAGPDELALPGRSGVGRARRPGQPPGRHRGVPARPGRVGDRGRADHRHRRAPAAAGPRRRARPRRGQRPARACAERRLGQLLGPLRRRCHRRPERVAHRVRPPEHAEVRGLLRARRGRVRREPRRRVRGRERHGRRLPPGRRRRRPPLHRRRPGHGRDRHRHRAQRQLRLPGPRVPRRGRRPRRTAAQRLVRRRAATPCCWRRRSSGPPRRTPRPSL